MPLNAESQFLSNDFLAAGLLENVPNRLQFLKVFPFYQIKGSSLKYVRTPQIAFAEQIGFCDDILEHTKLPDEPVEFKMSELATHFEVAYKSADVFCDVNPLFKLEQDLAIRQLLYRFAEQFETGDSGLNPNTFDGLRKIVSPDKVIDLACSPLDIQALDRAKGLVRTNNGYAGVIITNQLGYEFLRKTHYHVGSIPESVPFEVPDPMNGTKMQQATAFDGWVVLINDKQPVIECEEVLVAGKKVMQPKKGAKPKILEPEDLAKFQNQVPPFATNIWFAILGWNHLHGIIPSCTEETMFKLRKTIRPDNSKDVGHIVFPSGIALGSQCALAGVINATHPVKPAPPEPCICVIDHDYATLLIGNTTVETDVYNVTIPGDSDIDDIYLMQILGRLKNQSGATRNVTFRLYLGASVISFTEGFPGNANELTFRFDCRMIKNESVNSQKLFFFGEFKLNLNNGQEQRVGQIGTVAEDTTLNQPFRFTVQLPVANANLFLRAEARYLERSRV